MLNDNQAEMTLMEVQIQLEESSNKRGAETYMRRVNRAKAGVGEDHTQYGTTLVANRVKTLADAIRTFQQQATSGKAGAKHSVVRYIGDSLTPEQMAFLSLKCVIAGISGFRPLTYTAIKIGLYLEDEIRLAGIRAEEKKVYDSILRGTLKRGSQHYKHMYAIRRADYYDDSWVSWGDKTRTMVGAKMIELMVEHLDLITVELVTINKKKVAMISATPKTLELVEKYNMAGVRAPFEPMVVRPRDWTTPFDGGYIMSHITPLSLVKVSKRRLKDLYSPAEMPLIYEAINTLQHTEWQINGSVFDVMKELWKTGSEIAGIPSQGDLELPQKPDDIATNVAARTQWKKEAAEAHLRHIELGSHRVAFSMAMALAERYCGFKKIFMPYQLDFRGRVYAVPLINPQGCDYQKSLLRFSKGKPLGATGSQWLAIHGANVAGVDKVDFQTRVSWVEDNEDEILAIAADPFNNRGWAGSVAGVEIDKPWQFLAFCFEWAGFVEKGDSFVSHLPIALDGSCSGIQHYSAMLRDSVGGGAVNLIPADSPADVYQLVADKVLIEVTKDLQNGTEDSLTEEGTHLQGTKTLAAQWLSFGITRKLCKRPVMTLAYGSRQYGFKDQIMMDILLPAARDMGENFPFDKQGHKASGYMATKIWEAVTVTLVAAGQAMDWVKEVAAVANRAKQSIEWVTPAGFPVEQSYQNTKSIQVDTAINGRIQMRLDIALDSLDFRKQKSAIAPNWIHSLDASHMVMTICACKAAGIDSFAVIHDSFGTHAADTDSLFALVRDTFVDMYTNHEVLDSFKQNVYDTVTDETLREELPDDLIKGDLDLEEVKFSRYCFA